jgi:hypothetical protein
MVPLTTCQALQYALIPGTSEDFEKIAYDQRLSAAVEKSAVVLILPWSPLSQARMRLVESITILAAGIIGMLTSMNPIFATITAAGVLAVVLGASMLYGEATKVQTAWNSKTPQ